MEQCRRSDIKAGESTRQDDDAATGMEIVGDVHSSAAASSSFSPGLSEAKIEYSI